MSSLTSQITPTSPNDREFGVGAGMLKNMVQATVSTTVGLTITACSVVWAVSDYVHEGSLTGSLVTLAKGTATAIVVGTGLFMVIRDK